MRYTDADGRNLLDGHIPLAYDPYAPTNDNLHHFHQPLPLPPTLLNQDLNRSNTFSPPSPPPLRPPQASSTSSSHVLPRIAPLMNYWDEPSYQNDRMDEDHPVASTSSLPLSRQDSLASNPSAYHTPYVPFSSTSTPLPHHSPLYNISHEEEAKDKLQEVEEGEEELSGSAIYDSYGSSVSSINPLAKPLKLPASSSGPTTTNIDAASEIIFDPEKLGLPLPPDKGTKKNWAGLYSSSGFDLVGVLARVVLRPDPQLVLGPIDLSCSFVVCDASKESCPILYASETFSRMTCYTNAEVLGQNCRFLQSPEGTVHHVNKRPENNVAALEMKEAIAHGRESQVSLINYHKGGRPFMNLVSIIPVSWDTDQIAYFVGFQVDVGSQPSAVNQMSDGTFCVNYSQTSDIPPSIRPKWPIDDHRRNSSSSSSSSTAPVSFSNLVVAASSLVDAVVATHKGKETLRPPPPPPPVVSTAVMDQLGKQSLDNVLQRGAAGLVGDKARMAFNRLVLDKATDFIHVLTLKGTLLYVAPSARKLLDYEPTELTGQLLASFCHPSDVVNVLRDLKELASGTNPVVTLLYRIKKKSGDYIWLESSGKLLIQPGKGRKCVICSGRPREVYRLSRKDLATNGGLGDQEYWSKLSKDGKHLYTTPQVQQILGYSATELAGTAIDHLSPDGGIAAAITALSISNSDESVTIRHRIKAKEGGPVDVVTHLYPNSELPLRTDGVIGSQFAVIAQTNLYASEMNKKPFNANRVHPGVTSPSLSSHHPNESSGGVGGGPSSDRLGGTEDLANLLPSGLVSTFKTLSETRPDNLYYEMEVTNGTSIHFELQQLRLANKKLREERDLLHAHQAQQRAMRGDSHSSRV